MPSITTTRFAPSPTGKLHIGGARTALFSYLLAKKERGTFLLRIEDTDQKRFVAESVKGILDIMQWLGMSWSDKVIYQSERLPVYREYAEKLINENKAYYCFCSEERLAKMREEQQKNGEITKYDGLCRGLSKKETEEKMKEEVNPVIRLKVPKRGKIFFKDLVYGDIEFDLSVVDDQVLIKSDGFPTYQLASVVDDHEQKITHILRGEEWISSTPKNLLLYRFFGWGHPMFAHLPSIVGKNRRKLSKREGDVSVEDFRNKGYLPEAIINFVVMLGWNPGGEKEFFTKEELEKIFDIKRVHKSPALFDLEKLDFYNASYIRRKEIGELLEEIKHFSNIKFEKYEENFLRKAVAITRERMVTLRDFDLFSKSLFHSPKLEKEMIKFKKSFWNDTIRGLELILEELKKANESAWKSQGLLNDILSRTVETSGLKNGDIFWPVRYALSGEEKSPSPAELLWVLGREESLKRIKKALEKIIS